jgi:hypothetical protein
MYRLLMRAFPGYYAFNSIYAMFPFSLPDKTRQTLNTLGTLSSYSFDLPKKPPFSIATLSSMNYISDYHALIRVLNDHDTFKEMWGPSIKELTGTMYMLGWDTPETTDQHARLHKEIYGVDGSSTAMWDYFENITLSLIKRKGYKLGGRVIEIDAVREYRPFLPELTVVSVTSHLRIFSGTFSVSLSKRRVLLRDFLPKQNSLKFLGQSFLTYFSTPMRFGE